MERRISLPFVAIASVFALGLSACGDDSDSASATEPTTGETLPPVDTSPDDTSPDDTSPDDTGTDGIQHPTGADDVVLRIGYEGGFVPAEYAFLDLPSLLVTGDGRVIVQGPQIEIYPGPLLPNLQQRTISEAGIQALLQLAEEHDLFRDVTYDDPSNIADAPFTVVTISANGATYEHSAYALGLGGDGTESDEARAELESFVEQVSDVVTAAGVDTLGPEEPFEVTSYLIRATVADESTVDTDVAPTMVDWPADAAVRLSDASECATVPAESFADLFASATQLTWFVDDGVTYQLTVKPQLPGVPTC